MQYLLLISPSYGIPDSTQIIQWVHKILQCPNNSFLNKNAQWTKEWRIIQCSGVSKVSGTECGLGVRAPCTLGWLNCCCGSKLFRFPSQHLLLPQSQHLLFPPSQQLPWTIGLLASSSPYFINYEALPTRGCHLALEWFRGTKTRYLGPPKLKTFWHPWSHLSAKVILDKMHIHIISYIIRADVKIQTCHHMCNSLWGSGKPC